MANSDAHQLDTQEWVTALNNILIKDGPERAKSLLN